MAVRIAKTAGDNTPTLAGAEHDDLWMIMTRNWGGEGYCSQDNHFLDRNSFVFRLPPPQGFTPTRPPKIQKEGVDLKSNAQGLHWQDITPDGSREAVLRITLADPEIGSRVSGSIHVCWEDPCTVAHPWPSGLLQKAVTVKTRREKGPEEV